MAVIIIRMYELPTCFRWKSTPTVVLWCPEKKLWTYLLIMEVFPVAGSPNTNTFRTCDSPLSVMSIYQPDVYLRYNMDTYQWNHNLWRDPPKEQINTKLPHCIFVVLRYIVTRFPCKDSRWWRWTLMMEWNELTPKTIAPSKIQSKTLRIWITADSIAYRWNGW